MYMTRFASLLPYREDGGKKVMQIQSFSKVETLMLETKSTVKFLLPW